jgi:hypothetical protein
MARDANPIKTELITLSLNAQTLWYLDRLVELGLYGNNRTEAARIALYDHCKLLVAERKLDVAPPPVDFDLSVVRHPSPVPRR